ncbi:MAG: CidA/LrgA family protein [Ruminococcus sp.]|nr:CidA/LrgA family protein [Ruminococcus sp.]MCD7800762.1 CidA/LrgA family protein [Ruminococcus sp.]
MKILKQVLILIVISLLGEVLKYLLPLPFPSSIYGLIILFLALQFKILKLDDIKTISDFLISIMPIMFIPPSVGLMESYGLLKDLWLVVILVGIVSTFLIMTSTGLVSQMIIKKGGNKHD